MGRLGRAEKEVAEDVMQDNLLLEKTLTEESVNAKVEAWQNSEQGSNASSMAIQAK